MIGKTFTGLFALFTTAVLAADKTERRKATDAQIQRLLTTQYESGISL
jgi:hypothetical protein